MIDWLLVARNNAYGLTRDAELLAEGLALAGMRSAIAQRRERGLVDWLMRRRRAKNVLHIERAFPRWFGGADANWLIPNPERYPRRQLRRLKRLSGVLAKTRDAEALFSAQGVRTIYLGFTSEDRRDADIGKNWHRFFHLAGGNTLKGTEDILALWSAHPEWPELVLVQKAANAPKSVPANVTLMAGYMDDAELRRLQNGCGIHLCPSRAEGWGHYIVEGLSVGAVVVTTDSAPMNELVRPGTGMLVPAARSEPRHLGTCHFVDRDALERTIQGLIAMDAVQKEAIGAAARSHFEAIDAAFRNRCMAVFGPGGLAS